MSIDSKLRKSDGINTIIKVGHILNFLAKTIMY